VSTDLDSGLGTAALEQKGEKKLNPSLSSACLPQGRDERGKKCGVGGMGQGVGRRADRLPSHHIPYEARPGLTAGPELTR
jgi:hypothetical protein